MMTAEKFVFGLLTCAVLVGAVLKMDETMKERERRKNNQPKEK